MKEIFLPPDLERIHSSPLNIPEDNLIKALAESLSKHGFGGLVTEHDVADFLKHMSCSKTNGDEEHNMEKIKRHIHNYLHTHMSSFLKNEEELNNEYNILRVKRSGDIESIKIICEKKHFAYGSFNQIYHGILKTTIENHEVDTPVVVKVSSKPDNIEDNFTELFIHAILSIYQRRFLKNKYNNNLITPFILTSYNKDTSEFVTILEYVNGDITGLLRSNSTSSLAKKNMIDEVIFYQSCGLIPLQKDLKFIHGDNHTSNVFYILDKENEDMKYFFADFGFTRIEINSNILCAGYFQGFESMKSSPYYSSRKDLMQLIYSTWKYFLYSYDLFNTPEINMHNVELHIFNINMDTRYYSIYYPDIYTRDGNGNINNEMYAIFDPREMLKFFKANKPKYNNALCQKMIGPKWNNYIADSDDNEHNEDGDEGGGGASKPPHLTGGYDLYKRKYLKYKMKYTMLKK